MAREAKKVFTIDDCKSEAPVTLEYIAGALANDKTSSKEVTRMLVGMIARGEKFKAADKPSNKKPEASQPKG